MTVESEMLLGRSLNPNTLMWEGPDCYPVPDELMGWIQGPGPITMLDLVATLCLIEQLKRFHQRDSVEAAR